MQVMLFKIISLSFWNYNINESFSLHFLSSNPATHPCLFKFMSFFSVIVLYTHTHILIHTHRISQSYNLFSLYNTTCILVFRAVHWHWTSFYSPHWRRLFLLLSVLLCYLQFFVDGWSLLGFLPSMFTCLLSSLFRSHPVIFLILYKYSF